MPDYAVPKQPTIRKVPSRTPDYDPSKDRHVDHSFVVLDATRKHRTEIDLGNIKIPLKNGRAIIKDEALARELQQEHRFDATVSRVRTPSAADRGHKYFFSMPEMPWKKVKDGNKTEAQKENASTPGNANEAQQHGQDDGRSRDATRSDAPEDKA